MQSALDSMVRGLGDDVDSGKGDREGEKGLENDNDGGKDNSGGKDSQNCIDSEGNAKETDDIVSGKDLDGSKGKGEGKSIQNSNNSEGFEKKTDDAGNVIVNNGDKDETNRVQNVQNEGNVGSGEVGIESREAVVLKLKGIDNQNNKKVDFGVATQSINNFEGIKDGIEVNGYHNVKVGNRVENDQNLVDDRDLGDNIGLEMPYVFDSIEGNNKRSFSEEFDISSVKSDIVKVDCREVNIDDTKVEGKSKHLEIIKRKVKYVDSGDNLEPASAGHDIKVTVTSVVNQKPNTKNDKVDNVEVNVSDNDKPVVEKKGRNIHRNLDQHMENLKYLYYQEAEKFWNTNANTQIIERNVTKKVRNFSEKVETLNDLVGNLKVCSKQNDKKAKEMSFFARTKGNIKSENVKAECNASVVINENIDFQSASLNKIVMRKNNIKHNTNTDIHNKIKDEKTDKKLDIKPNKVYKQEHFENNNFETHNTNEKFKDSKSIENRCVNKPDTYHTNVVQTLQSNIQSHEQDVSNAGNQFRKVNDDKENNTVNVKDSKQDLNIVVKIDDGMCIRSAVLLRKVELSKKT